MREAFEKQIDADPYDITTRRVYADWLDENTDEAELATFHRETTEKQIREGMQFLKGFAVRYEGDFDELIEGLKKYVKGRHHFMFGEGLGFDTEERLDDAVTATHFWKMFSHYTGIYYMPKVEVDGEENPFICCG